MNIKKEKGAIRSCFVSGKKYYKYELYRLSKNSLNKYEIDLENKKKGRGLYFKNSVNLNKFLKISEKKKILIDEQSINIIKNILV